MEIHSIAWWPTVAVLVIVTATDLWKRRIPNLVVLPYFVAGMMVSVWQNGWHGLWHSLGGVAAGAALFGVLHLMGGMGAGDVKLMAAIGAWIGAGQMLFALVFTGLAGGVIALGWAASSGFIGELLTGSGELMFGWRQRGLKAAPELQLSNPRARKMPYAPAIALGTLLSFFAH